MEKKIGLGRCGCKYEILRIDFVNTENDVCVVIEMTSNGFVSHKMIPGNKAITSGFIDPEALLRFLEPEEKRTTGSSIKEETSSSTSQKEDKELGGKELLESVAALRDEWKQFKIDFVRGSLSDTSITTSQIYSIKKDVSELSYLVRTLTDRVEAIEKKLLDLEVE